MSLIRSVKVRSALKLVAWIIIVQLVLVNISAALYAYKFTHFYDYREPSSANGNVISKTWKLFVGPKYYKQSKQQIPPFECDSVELTTTSGRKIQGWYGTAAHAQACVILLHGITVNKSYLLNEADYFRKLNYNVLLIDFRAHGSSSGHTSTFGVDETDEVKAAFDYATAKGNKKIVLYGMSLGAVVAMKTAAEGKVHPAAIIAEMPFATLQHHLRSRAKGVGFPAQPFAFLVTLWIGIERGYNGFNHKTNRYAGRIGCPVLLQWGEQDDFVSRKEIDVIYESLGKNKKLVTYADGGHGSLIAADPQKWTSEITSFLNTLP